jgi:hypothetical protein
MPVRYSADLRDIGWAEENVPYPSPWSTDGIRGYTAD